MPTDPLDVPPGSLTLEAITDLLDSGGVPAGITGDIQLNNGGAFGNASAVFPGTVLEIDSSENLVIDLSANDGGMLFTGGEILASTVGNMQFESDSGDVSFTASTGRFDVVGSGATFVANTGDGINFDTTSSPDPSPIILQGNANIRLLTLSIFANNAAAIVGGLGVGDLYRTGADPDVVCVVH